MNRNRIALISMMVGAAFSCSAVGPLQFTNVTSSLGNSSGQTLFGVAYNGTNTFASAGLSSTTLAGTFIVSASNKWTFSTVSNVSLKLDAVAFGNGSFITSGSNDLVFSSPDGTTWNATGNVFSNGTETAGLAFNAGAAHFVAVGQAPEISWAGSFPLAWAPGTLTNKNAAILESFRAATPFGPNGFAACGLFGDVRLSADGGMTWNTNRGSTSLLALLGIAADDGQTLVSVGVNGSSIYSTGGMNWNNSVNPSSSTLNAVAYAGANGGFVAVGNGGTILVSSDGGATWIQQPTNATTLDLYGVAFARTNLYSGVGMIVGQGGTVILAGTAPPPAILPVNQTNFSSSLPNMPLSVTISNDLDHPAGTVTIDWYNSSGVQVFSNSTSFTPSDSAAAGDNTPSNYTYYAVSRDLRTGFTNSTPPVVVLSIVPRPKSTLTSPLVRTNCNDGSSFTLTNVLTGIGPWIIQWSTGDVQTNNNGGPGPVINTLTLFPTNSLRNSATNYTYSVTNLIAFLTNNGGIVVGTALPGDLTSTNELIVNPRPTETITSLDRTNCNDGSAYVITADLTGIAPWTVMWSDGAVSNYASSPAIRTVFPTDPNPNATATYMYWIAALSDANCTAEPQDFLGTNTVTINPRPTSTLTSLATTVCNEGQPFTLTNVLTGLGPWTVVWSSNGVPVPQTINVPAAGPYTNTFAVVPTNTFLNTAYTNVYFVQSVSNSGTACIGNQAGDITGEVDVAVNPRPTSALVSFVTTNCDNGLPLTLTNVLTGLGPWTVVWSSNSVLVTQPVNVAAAGPFTNTFTVVPTNTAPDLSYTNIYFVQSVSNNGTLCIGDQSADLTGQVKVVINPLPLAPVSLGNVTNCFGITNPPLSVTVTNGATADWFDATTNLLFSGTVNYVPTNTAVGVYTNYALTRLTGLGCTSTNFTQVLFVIEDCTNAISGIKLSGTNAVIQWYGNFVLQSATNLTPPVDWTNLTQGGAGMTNYWTNSTVPPPADNFFRLYAPTN